MMKWQLDDYLRSSIGFVEVENFDCIQLSRFLVFGSLHIGASASSNYSFYLKLLGADVHFDLQAICKYARSIET